MSRKRGIQHRRRPRRSHHGLPVHIIASWAPTEADLPEIRQQTHDLLIKTMDEGRRTGVKWVWGGGAAGARLLDTLAEEEGIPLLLVAYYATLRRTIDEEGGYIVLAMADGDPV